MDQSKNMVTILLVAVAVLLAAIAGILVYQNTNDSLPAPTVSTDPPATSDPMMGNPAPVAAAFDPATAPRVPAEQTPEQFVTGYYEACMAAEWDAAFAMLPTDKQAYYGDVAGFSSTLMGYGVTSFEVAPQVESEGVISVLGTQQAQGMGFPYTWSFVQDTDGTWLCQSREMGGN